MENKLDHKLDHKIHETIEGNLRKWQCACGLVFARVEQAHQHEKDGDMKSTTANDTMVPEDTMAVRTPKPRITFEVYHPDLPHAVKIAAVKRKMTNRQFCLMAIASLAPELKDLISKELGYEIK